MFPLHNSYFCLDDVFDLTIVFILLSILNEAIKEATVINLLFCGELLKILSFHLPFVKFMN